jgi:hypothetical protein
MEDSLYVVPVRIQDECSVVAWVVASFSWRAIVAATRSKRHLIERLDRVAIDSLKGQMDSRDRPFCLVNPKLIGREVILVLEKGV